MRQQERYGVLGIFAAMRRTQKVYFGKSFGDARRTFHVHSRGFRVIRFWNNEVLGNVEGVVAKVADALE